MKIWKDRDGKWIDAKEFGSRWKAGIESVTPLAQTRSQLVFTWITLIGILCGLVVSIISYKSLWWLGIILVAALGNTFIGMIGIYQKYRQLKRVEAMQLMSQEEYDQIYPLEAK